jgi:hypothetical protein
MKPASPDVNSSIGANNEAVYFQFSKDCASRVEQSVAIIESWRTKIHDLPEFVRISSPIKPSPATIDVRGKWWRD